MNRAISLPQAVISMAGFPGLAPAASFIGVPLAMTLAPVRTAPPLVAHVAVAPADEALDLVFIEGFEGRTVIGIHSSELHEPQPLRIDIVAGTPRSPARLSDDIADTIDYSVVLEALRELMRDHGVRLLEAFAEQVAQLLLERFHAQWVRVRVVKPNKFPDAAAVGVCIERRRSAMVAAPHTSANVLSFLGRGMVPDDR
jgi:dihydroneopterin aldolase